ncbi:IS66-like element accessory protein TnpA [Burkholderia cenocepacia]|uniref:IS66-like element accessory protein TnpA n=1 Tax=Burkholderia cenocepacia TaxID=95486 RepID=UPI002ABDC6B2|nr:transposase [Burkholderia cenocepacia]
MSIIFDLMDITVTESEARLGSRKGRPNHDPEFRRRLSAAACEPGVSVAKLARENGINANMLFSWRRRYRAQLQAATTSLIPVTVLHETSPDASVVGHPTAQDGTIEIRIGGAVIKVNGVVDADTLRVVLGSLRS